MQKKWIDLNRWVSWFFAVGYVAVHYLWPLRHGEGDLMTMDPIPRAFFMTSFLWMSAHAWMGWRLYGLPTFRPRTLREIYVLSAWLVLLVTTPIFSIPALGASPVLMAVAWPPLAVHLALNAWFLCGRAKWAVLRGTGVRLLVICVWLVWILGAALRSFPHF